MNRQEIENKFANSNNMYYAHGIGGYDPEVVKSIFENGLRCSHNELYWTVIEFGRGSETLFKEQEESLHNWNHKDSKHIIIASLPEAFHLLDIQGTPLFQKRHAAFYHKISPEKASELGIAAGLYLKPEFVMGMYDAEKEDFVNNDRYYENLSEKEQEEILEAVKKQYIEVIQQTDWTLEEYAQILEEVGILCPLTREERRGLKEKKLNLSTEQPKQGEEQRIEETKQMKRLNWLKEMGQSQMQEQGLDLEEERRQNLQEMQTEKKKEEDEWER